jgi:hypothetical protein
VRSSPGVLGEAFIGAGVEGSGRRTQRNGWRWWGASMALAISALKGGVERMGPGTISRRGVGRRHRGGSYADQRWRQLQPVVACGVIERRKKPGWPGGLLGSD